MLQLKIVSPEKVEFSGAVQSVRVPGTLGSFEILTGHAPLISSLDAGEVMYKTAENEDKKLAVKGGFVEVQKNAVSVCVEI